VRLEDAKNWKFLFIQYDKIEEKLLKSRVVLCKFIRQGNANKNKELQKGSLNLILIKNYFWQRITATTKETQKENIRSCFVNLS
jgi:hypothetical protein